MTRADRSGWMILSAQVFADPDYLYLRKSPQIMFMLLVNSWLILLKSVNQRVLKGVTLWAVLWPPGDRWPGVTAVHMYGPHGQARASGDQGDCPVVISHWPHEAGLSLILRQV